MAKRIWDDLISEQDRKVYGTGAFGGTVGLGERPGVVIIDVMNKSIGDEPLPILEAIARYGKGCCGEYGWNAVWKIRELLDIAHARGIPVFYSIPSAPEAKPADAQVRFNEKMPNWRDYAGNREGWDFADEIAPVEGDIVIRKPTASSFYRTDLEEQLRDHGVDTLLVTGTTTSGCVRATVVDGFLRGFKINVVEDAVFDRGQVTHAINLFDIQAKYGDVLPLDALKTRLEEAARVSAAR
jgi:nicotinamidase-related amidase